MTPEQLTEVRQYYLAAPVILPMLERFRRDALSRLMSQHFAGDMNFAPLVAELAVLQRIEIEFKGKEATYRQLEEKHNAGKK